MWRLIATIGVIAAIGVGLGASADAAKRSDKTRVPHMKVTSDQISRRGTISDEQVANTFGCKGGNVSPEIKWSGAPAGTKSFAVSIYDPDAPTGSGFWHWVVFNIPATATELPRTPAT